MLIIKYGGYLRKHNTILQCTSPSCIFMYTVQGILVYSSEDSVHFYIIYYLYKYAFLIIYYTEMEFLNSLFKSRFLGINLGLLEFLSVFLPPFNAFHEKTRAFLIPGFFVLEGFLKTECGFL